MLGALAGSEPMFFAGESQGSILVGRALVRARDSFVEARRGELGEAGAQAAFERLAGERLRVVTYGNAFADYPDGPRYLHLSIAGDPVPDNGSRPDNRPPNERRTYVIFDQVFPGHKNFENHNIAVVHELLRHTCELHGVASGDLPAIFDLFQGANAAVGLANHHDVRWPADMKQQLWQADKNWPALAG